MSFTAISREDGVSLTSEEVQQHHVRDSGISISALHATAACYTVPYMNIWAGLVLCWLTSTYWLISI